MVQRVSGRFYLRTFGCQMNQHDAEKMANLLVCSDYRPAEQPQDADVLLIHTCSVRERAEHKLYSELGALAQYKRARPGLVIGVGGCVAQQEGAALLRRFAHLDFVFGPQNLRHLPALIAAAQRSEREARLEYEADREARFELPELHPEFRSATPGRAFVTVMEGCDLHCAFCVVPRTRGREVSRPSAAILREVAQQAERGVREVTLLGQTVNAYGRRRPGSNADEIPFAELLRRIAEVPGIERIRFTSPHPIFVDAALISAYAELPQLCPHLHLPVQSGSDRVLAAMNRRYDREQYLERVRQVRAARPGIALTTDLIVGFPGESDADFADTLSLMEEADFADSFSFKYSPRPGTPVLRRPLEPICEEVASARLAQLQALQHRLTLAHHQSWVGRRTVVLCAGASRQGGSQLHGRNPQHRLVNFSAERPVAAGELVSVEIAAATPHSLLGALAPTHPAAELLPLV
jgi:tRNA-2-methylthio-N6-dimethylallyladenosine synthase